jgi:hypothetical protein
LDKGFRFTPVPEGMRYEKLRLKALYVMPVPRLKYWRLPFDGLS